MNLTKTSTTKQQIETSLLITDHSQIPRIYLLCDDSVQTAEDYMTHICNRFM